MIEHLLQCLTPWTHEYGWPIRGRQTCVRCGRERAASIDFAAAPRMDAPRRELRAVEGAAPPSKLVQIGKVRRRRGA